MPIEYRTSQVRQLQRCTLPRRLAAMAVAVAVSIAWPASASAGTPVDSEVVFDWRFATPSERRPWRGASRRGLRLGVRVPIHAGKGHIEREVSLEAETLHALEVTLATPDVAGIAVAWRRAGELYSNQNRIAVPAALRPRTLTFDLRAESA